MHRTGRCGRGYEEGPTRSWQRRGGIREGLRKRGADKRANAEACDKEGDKFPSLIEGCDHFDHCDEQREREEDVDSFEALEKVVDCNFLEGNRLISEKSLHMDRVVDHSEEDEKEEENRKKDLSDLFNEVALPDRKKRGLYHRTFPRFTLLSQRVEKRIRMG